MRYKNDWATYLGTGLPKRYWNNYLDEVTPLNDEQKSCIGKLREVAEGKWWSLVILGTVGNGKTTLVSGLISQWVYQHPWDTFYVTQESLIDRCRATFGEGSSMTENEVIYKYSDCSLLVIDELTVRGYSDYARNILQKILSRRHGNNMRTVLIGNLDVDTFKGMFDEHILSRLREGETQIMRADDMRVHGEF